MANKLKNSIKCFLIFIISFHMSMGQASVVEQQGLIEQRRKNRAEVANSLALAGSALAIISVGLTLPGLNFALDDKMALGYSLMAIGLTCAAVNTATGFTAGGMLLCSREKHAIPRALNLFSISTTALATMFTLISDAILKYSFVGAVSVGTPAAVCIAVAALTGAAATTYLCFRSGVLRLVKQQALQSMALTFGLSAIGIGGYAFDFKDKYPWLTYTNAVVSGGCATTALGAVTASFYQFWRKKRELDRDLLAATRRPLPPVALGEQRMGSLDGFVIYSVPPLQAGPVQLGQRGRSGQGPFGLLPQPASSLDGDSFERADVIELEDLRDGTP